MKKVITTCAILAMVILIAGSCSEPRHTFKPKEGYVPDAETAIAIAIATWNPIYGKDQIAREKPYKATFSNGIWTVVGSLPAGMAGGVAEADIAKDDARILRVSHGK
jgi:hypothetical protein